MRYKQGDIVLLPYPYTDFTQTKQRPAIIISRDEANYPNYIVAKITSVIRSDAFSFAILSADLDRELIYNSEVRTNEIFTINHRIIIKRFASLNQNVLAQLTKKIQEHISVG